jgi:hypothetical protein
MVVTVSVTKKPGKPPGKPPGGGQPPSGQNYYLNAGGGSIAWLVADVVLTSVSGSADKVLAVAGGSYRTIGAEAIIVSEPVGKPTTINLSSGLLKWSPAPVVTTSVSPGRVLAIAGAKYSIVGAVGVIG